VNIALIITGLGLGGAETQVCSLADHLVKLGHKVSLISVVAPTEVLPSSPEVNVIELFCKRSAGGFVSAIIKLNKELRRIKPDVVHSHMVHANLISRISRIFVPVDVHVSTAHSTFEGGKLLMSAYRLTDGLTDLTTNVSKNASSAFVINGAVPSARIVAMHNGIDIDKFSFDARARKEIREQLGFADSTKMILAVGRLEHEKDYPNLLNALALLKERYLDIQLIIVGKGRELANLKALTNELKLDKLVSFVGTQSDVHRWYSAADIFVLSSAWEGFGLVIAEAMATELPVIVTDCGGTAEVVGNYGRLVPTQDPNSLSTQIYQELELLEVDGQRNNKGREWIISQYSMKAITDKWLELYRNPTA
jgi:glycosyltransferase involved in cell wall biosynthesis